jgi:hypothetical protein
MTNNTSTYHMQHSEMGQGTARNSPVFFLCKKEYNVDAKERVHFRLNVIPKLCEHQCLAEHLF